MDNKVALALALKRKQEIDKSLSFDPLDLKSRPTPQQQEIIDDFFNSHISNLFIMGGNQSGKTMLTLRIISYLFNNERHLPLRKNPDEPYLILVFARTSKQIEQSLFLKLERCLDPLSYKIIRVGNIIQAIHHKDNGNRIVFSSYENEHVAKERAQSYTADVAIIDELCKTKEFIEEVQRRLQAKNGKLLMPFTPKSPNPRIKEIVDNAQLPYAKCFKLSMMQNPVYTEEDKAKILYDLSTYSDSYRRTVLEGDWLQGDNLVYHIDPETVIENPTNYAEYWNHVESSDPAIESSHGLLLAAECPNSGLWYVIHADYIESPKSPTHLLESIFTITSKVKIVRRISDTMTWFISAAREKYGWNYLTPYDKNNRRLEMIAKVQENLGKKVKIAPWCTKLLDELAAYEWSDRGEGKIVNADKYHLLDSLRYLIDNLPTPSLVLPPTTSQAFELRKADLKRRKENESGSSIKSIRIKKHPKSWGVRRLMK